MVISDRDALLPKSWRPLWLLKPIFPLRPTLTLKHIIPLYSMFPVIQHLALYTYTYTSIVCLNLRILIRLRPYVFPNSFYMHEAIVLGVDTLRRDNHSNSFV